MAETRCACRESEGATPPRCSLQNAGRVSQDATRVDLAMSEKRMARIASLWPAVSGVFAIATQVRVMVD